MYQVTHYKEASLTIELQPIDLCAECGFVLGNAIKYILRSDYKNHFEDDLIKARDYLNFLRNYLENNQDALILKLSPRAIIAGIEYCKKSNVLAILFENYQTLHDWYTSTQIVIKDDQVKKCIHEITSILEH